MSEKKESHCKLKLDIGIYVETPGDLGEKLGKIWLDVVDKFGDRPPTEIISEKEKNVYVCNLYLKDKKICEKCPAYQP